MKFGSLTDSLIGMIRSASSRGKEYKDIYKIMAARPNIGRVGAATAVGRSIGSETWKGIGPGGRRAAIGAGAGLAYSGATGDGHGMRDAALGAGGGYASTKDLGGLARTVGRTSAGLFRGSS